MKKFAIKYSLEFVVIVLGITISYWINDIQIHNQESEKEKVILNSILSDIEQIETYINARKKTLSSDSIWMDYLIKNWDNVNIDSTAKEFSQNRYDASFHNLFLDFREFHPPIATLEMVTSDGSFSIIKNDLIKRKINSIVYLSKEQLIKNSEVEINLTFAPVGEADRVGVTFTGQPAHEHHELYRQPELDDRWIWSRRRVKREDRLPLFDEGLEELLVRGLGLPRPGDESPPPAGGRAL